MSVSIKRSFGKDCITVKIPDANNITVTGEFYLDLPDLPSIEFTAKITCVLSENDIDLTHDIIWIDEKYSSLFEPTDDDIKTYFNTLIRIVNFRMNIEIKTL